MKTLLILRFMCCAAAIVLLAGPSSATRITVGGESCNSQAAKKQYSCNRCTLKVYKCNQAQGDKTKLCNVDAGTQCNTTVCADNTYGDTFSTTACDPVYN